MINHAIESLLKTKIDMELSFVAKEDNVEGHSYNKGKLIGASLILEDNNVNEKETVSLFVAPEWQGFGIAEPLFTSTINEMIHRDIPLLKSGYSAANTPS